VIQWDDGGTLTNAGSNKYVNSFVYASNDQDYPIAVVVGQAVHNTAAAARNEGVPLFPSVATREFKLLYRAIYKNVGGTATYQEATDLREVSTGPGSDYTAASHTDLTNRDALSSHPASAITPDTTNFDGALSTADDDVQKALETLNAVVADPSAATTAFVMGTGSSVAGQWYYLAAGVWVIGDAAAAACAVSMVGLAKGTNPEVDGMALRGIVTAGTWLAADRGAAVYLDDAGVFTLTCPTEALNPGEIRRIVGWVHSTAEIRMIEHAGGVLDGGS